MILLPRPVYAIAEENVASMAWTNRSPLAYV